MQKCSRIKSGEYYDSVTLMKVQKDVAQSPGVIEVGIVMGTEANKMILRQAGLVTAEVEGAKAEDLVISVAAETTEAAKQALDDAAELLSQKKTAASLELDYFPKSFEAAIKMLPDASLELISIPGRFAKEEAMKALKHDLHVMLFSDNVTIEEELELKKEAASKGLLMMGPDCGTAIINGVGLGFANHVCRGRIGIIGASGTGIQEVSSLIHARGEGISHAIGTGGRDLSPEIGGITMMQGLDSLEADPTTEVIVLISKPPAEEVAGKVLQRAERCTKPVVVNFVGSQKAPDTSLVWAKTLEEAAWLAVLLARKQEIRLPENQRSTQWNDVVIKEKKLKSTQQKFVRALYSGGTLAYEALFLMKPLLGEIYSNLAKEPEYQLKDPTRSIGHSIVDLGDDVYTVGRPHPMIDNAFRAKRIVQEALDPETAVILLDIVLGYGSQLNPLNDLLPAIEKAREEADRAGRHLSFVAYVCGTDKDPQEKDKLCELLTENGVLLASSNVQAAQLAGTLV